MTTLYFVYGVTWHFVNLGVDHILARKDGGNFPLKQLTDLICCYDEQEICHYFVFDI